jgi:predicted 3-demethylubiquinone-9 3-methyltransferase (glyoxalase superfamily)
MPIATQKIMPCLWFDSEGEVAAKHYVSIFRIRRSAALVVTEQKEKHSRQRRGNRDDGRVRAGGQKFLALNGSLVQVRRSDFVSGVLRYAGRSITSGTSSPVVQGHAAG